MEKASKYEQLKPEDRVAIAGLRLQGEGMRAIARVLGRSASTVSRELRRNSCPESGYISDRAQAFHATRRAAARPARKLDMDGVAWGIASSCVNRLTSTALRAWPDL